MWPLATLEHRKERALAADPHRPASGRQRRGSLRSAASDAAAEAEHRSDRVRPLLVARRRRATIWTAPRSGLASSSARLPGDRHAERRSCDRADGDGGAAGDSMTLRLDRVVTGILHRYVPLARHVGVGRRRWCRARNGSYTASCGPRKQPFWRNPADPVPIVKRGLSFSPRALPTKAHGRAAPAARVAARRGRPVPRFRRHPGRARRHAGRDPRFADLASAARPARPPARRPAGDRQRPLARRSRPPSAVARASPFRARTGWSSSSPTAPRCR